MQLKNKTVMVYGAAKSGISAACMLQKLGAEVILFDCNTNLTKEALKDKINIQHDFILITGVLPEEYMERIDLLVLSPGVATDNPDIRRVKNKNIPIWGEIELAYRYTKGKILGITGTNGKTTTTTLVGEIMKAHFDEVYVVGNIGNSYSDAALTTTENAVTVIELSSFQLETIHNLKLDISAILNITPDHLDRHHSMANYIAAKERITMNQTKHEICILNYEDIILREMEARIPARVLYFSSVHKLTDGIFLDGEDIIYSEAGNQQLICSINELHVLGNHNYENVMAAVGMAISMKIPMNTIRRAVLSFQGVEHRIEFVETIKGVTYYNDSKGTNPDASIRAIQAMRCPTVLIAGGYDKKIPFDDLVVAFQNKVKCLVLLGQTSEQIAQTARMHGFKNILLADNLREAVQLSARNAVPGDSVLLSPACASWGMFDNFEQRGRLFKEYVREML